MAIELFLNDASTTVAASQTAVSAGTTQTWTVASSSLFTDAGGLTAATGVSQFRVVDPADVQQPPEVILVTNVSGTTWSVTRGAENTTPTAHSSGFTVQAIATSMGLQSLQRTLREQLLLPTGAIAETWSRTTPSTILTMVSGTAYICALPLLAGQVVTNINWRSGSTQGITTANTTHQWSALCNISSSNTGGNVLAVSADGTNSAWAAGSTKTFAMGTPYTVPTTGLYCAVLCVVATGTMMTCISVTGFETDFMSLAGPFPVANVTGKTGPPTVGTSIGSLSVPTEWPWGYVS